MIRINRQNFPVLPTGRKRFVTADPVNRGIRWNLFPKTYRYDLPKLYLNDLHTQQHSWLTQ